MSDQTPSPIPGNKSPAEAARALGVTLATMKAHQLRYGNLARLQRRAAAKADPRGIVLPDGSRAATEAEAAQKLGMSISGIFNHLCTYGHLRGAGTVHRVKGAGAQHVSLSPVPGIEVDPLDPRPETAPRRNMIVSARPVDVAAVIATIRQCRDDVLAERGGAT